MYQFWNCQECTCHWAMLTSMAIEKLGCNNHKM